VLLTALAAGKARAELTVWTLTQTRRVLREEPAGVATSVKMAAALLRTSNRAG